MVSPAWLPAAVRQRGGGRLIDDAHHLQTGQFAGDLGGFALPLVEKGGHGDHGLADGLAQLAFALLFQFAQDEGGDFLRRKLLLAEPHPSCPRPSCA